MREKKTSHYLLLIAALLATAVRAEAQAVPPQTKLPAHPRLLWTKAEEASVKAAVMHDFIWKKVHKTILDECNNMLTEAPVKQQKIGRRLLDKSRTCLRRVFYLSYAYRMTKEVKYARRAEAELLAAATFTDWNPTHFLDVGEMAMALSIGYDWLYDKLSPASRTAIAEAILKKGLEPSLDTAYNRWLTSKGNWNQVCNAGMAYGAIATYEHHPELSQRIINRAVATIPLPMQQYEPEGNYVEGYMYWEYGTSFNAMFLSALQSAFGTDFGLADGPGFRQTPQFLAHLTGPSGKPFNYADCISTAQFNPAPFWFASRSNDPSLLWIEKKNILANDSLRNRLLPAAVIWGRGINTATIKAPEKRMWVGSGESPVAMMRTSWTDPDAVYVGFKGGSPSSGHAHMDVGSFVMDANGVRWAMDFGMQDYESLESKGLDLWNKAQGSDRWKVFRYNNFAHNTLAVNNGLQRAKGASNIISFSSSPRFMNAVADLTPVYDSLLQSAVRGVAVVNDRYVVVRDELTPKENGIIIRWSMVTPAAVNILNDSTAELTNGGKKLLLKTALPFPAKLKTWSTTPTTAWDAPNPGTTIIGFEVELPRSQQQTLTVYLLPQGKGGASAQHIPALRKWPKDN